MQILVRHVFQRNVGLFTDLATTGASVMLFLALFLQLTLCQQQSQYYIDAVHGEDQGGCGLVAATSCKSLGFTVQSYPPNSNEPIYYYLATGFYNSLKNTNITWAPGPANPPLFIVGSPDQTAEVDFGGLATIWTFSDYPANVALINLTLQNMFGAGIYYYSTATGTTAPTFTVTNCIFQRNKFGQVPSNFYPYGSALSIHAADAVTTITNTQFIGNGGDISVDSYGPLVVTAGSVYITQSVFTQNTADNGPVVAYCSLQIGCNQYVLDISNSSIFINTGNSTGAILVNGYSVRVANSLINSNTASDSTVKVIATKNPTRNGVATFAQTSIVNNTARHGLNFATLGLFTSYASYIKGSTVQFNNNSYDAGLGVGVFCNTSQLSIDGSIVATNFNTNGSAGGAVDYFGFNCQPSVPTLSPTPTGQPTAPSGPNAAAIVVPLFLIALLLAVGILAYYKWDRIKSYFGRNEYTRINEGTRF